MSSLFGFPTDDFRTRKSCRRVPEAFTEFNVVVFKITELGALIYKPQNFKYRTLLLFEPQKIQKKPHSILTTLLLLNVDFSLPALNFGGSRVRVPPDFPLQRSQGRQLTVLVFIPFIREWMDDYNNHPPSYLLCKVSFAILSHVLEFQGQGSRWKFFWGW